MHIPSVRAILEDAAAKRTRNPEVYLALTKIYSEDIKRIEEAVRLQQKTAEATVARRESPHAPADPAPDWRSYMRGDLDHFGYDLLSLSDKQPHANRIARPYYPQELLSSKVSGEVVLDVQVTDEGKVGGVWLVSAAPEIFESLAAAAVREWEFEPIGAENPHHFAIHSVAVAIWAEADRKGNQNYPEHQNFIDRRSYRPAPVHEDIPWASIPEAVPSGVKTQMRAPISVKDLRGSAERMDWVAHYSFAIRNSQFECAILLDS